MDEYWMKSENKEIASKKLDDDMDSYWAKKGDATTATEEGGDDATAEGEDEKPAADTADT